MGDYACQVDFARFRPDVQRKEQRASVRLILLCISPPGHWQSPERLQNAAADPLPELSIRYSQRQKRSLAPLKAGEVEELIDADLLSERSIPQKEGHHLATRRLPQQGILIASRAWFTHQLLR